MQQQKIYTTYDSKTESYGQPFFLPTAKAAIRAFSDECNNPESNLCRHAGDYTLFELGEYDTSKGKITVHKTPASLGLGTDYKETNIEQMKV